MLRDRVRRVVRRLARGVRRAAGRSGVAATEAPVPAAETTVAAPAAAPAVAEPTPASAAPAVVDADDQVGPALTREQVDALFADMVRPALQADGGDIDLIKVQDNDVYVRLLGACRGCPSSTITMRMGIERLLAEEFPQFRNLVEIDAVPQGEAFEGGA